MNPEAIARLRHSLRTPLNHLIGYAEMVRNEADEQSATAEAGMMELVLAAARQMVEQIQEVLPLKAHIAEDAVPVLRAALGPWLQRVEKTLSTFEEATGGACAEEVRKMRGALGELRGFAAGAAEPDRTVPIQLPPASEKRPRNANGRILVVDDDRDTRETLARRLEREGYHAVSEPDGAAALARLDHDAFDLVLLDLFMPGMDGFQVLSEMKRRLELQEIPVIVLSASGDPANAVRSIEMGAEDFLAKPYDPVILRARIGAILRRRRAETERAEMADSLQLLLESTGEGVCGEDREGRCVFVNRAALEMLRCSREDLLGRDLHAAIHHSRPDGSPYPAEACPIRSVLRTGEPRRGRDETLFRADGMSFPIEFSARPIWRDGRGEGLVLTFTDITERKRTEESLLQSAKLESLGVLAGGVAHDFNDLLTGILGNTNLVLDSLPAADPNRGRLGEVVAAGERAAELTRQMLVFAGTGQFAVEPMDLSKAIEDVGELLGATLPKQARLKLALGRQLWPIEADPRQIRQLIFHLAINAGEAIGERNGVVTIETGMRDLPEGAPGEASFGRIAPGRYVYASVQDTGAGMSEQPRGQGMAAAMGIARAHRGTIRVESAPGKGSRFEVLLPAAATRVFHMPAAQIESRAAQTVLVVDDEEVVRKAAGAVLEQRGYRVLLAGNGRQAVDIVRERAPEIAAVLLDLTMPAMDGEEVARQMHAIRDDIPILLSGGQDEEAAMRRFSGSRVAGYLRKPYTAKTLLERIKAVAR
jgi:PAS domain S-box-containing protein